MADEKQRAQAAEVRKVLKNVQERGEEVGREKGWEDGLKHASRQALLEVHAEALEAAAKRVEDEPATTGFKEAAGILRDLAAQGPPETSAKVIERKAG